MKTLSNHTILFDAECPMCRTISKGLVKSGLSTEEASVSYQQFPEMVCPMLDRQRAANEIALINNDTGEVSYGVESLFKLLATSYPRLRPLLSFAPFIWFMSKIYALIAFNRRIIVPPPEKGDRFSIQPTFRLDYRLAYLVLCWLMVASVFTAYLRLPGMLPSFGNPYSLYPLMAGLPIFQGVILHFINKDKVWSYLGNLMTILAGASLLLLPVLLLAPWIGQAPLFYQLFLSLILILMLAEHFRRSKGLQMGAMATLTGALYILICFILFHS